MSDMDIGSAYANPELSKRVQDITNMWMFSGEMSDAHHAAFASTVLTACLYDPTGLHVVLESLGVIEKTPLEDGRMAWGLVRREPKNVGQVMDDLIESIRSVCVALAEFYGIEPDDVPPQ